MPHTHRWWGRYEWRVDVPEPTALTWQNQATPALTAVSQGLGEGQHYLLLPGALALLRDESWSLLRGNWP